MVASGDYDDIRIPAPAVLYAETVRAPQHDASIAANVRTSWYPVRIREERKYFESIK